MASMKRGAAGGRLAACRHRRAEIIASRCSGCRRPGAGGRAGGSRGPGRGGAACAPAGGAGRGVVDVGGASWYGGECAVCGILWARGGVVCVVWCGVVRGVTCVWCGGGG